MLPVLLLRFFDEPLQFFNPLSCQLAYDHILHRLNHFTFLSTLPPEGREQTRVSRRCLHSAHTGSKQETVSGLSQLEVSTLKQRVWG